MAVAKTITLYLMDGFPNGKIKAQISGWSGIAYKIPRTLLAECKELDPFKRSGVYFLFGQNTVYVGQAEVRKTGKGIHQRLLEHESDKLKDSWDEVVMFTTKDDTFGKTEISYLENQFYNMALHANRFDVKNNNEPSIGTVTEEKESELQDYIEKAELLLGALGYKVFEEVSPCESITKPTENNTVDLPPLPSTSLGPCEFAKQGIIALLESGFSFTDEQMKRYSSVEGSKEYTHRNCSMFLLLKDGETRKDVPQKLRQRYWAKEFVSEKYRFLVFSQWYEGGQHGAHKDDFIAFYESLKYKK